MYNILFSFPFFSLSIFYTVSPINFGLFAAIGQYSIHKANNQNQKSKQKNLIFLTMIQVGNGLTCKMRLIECSANKIFNSFPTAIQIHISDKCLKPSTIINSNCVTNVKSVSFYLLL